MKNAVLAALLACSIVVTPAAAADRLTIDARDAEIGDVIRLIGSESGTNIVPDASVKAQRITFHLNGVDAATALATLAQAYNLQIHRAGTVVIVGDAATMNRRYLDTGIAGGAQTTVFTLTRAKPDTVCDGYCGYTLLFDELLYVTTVVSADVLWFALLISETWTWLMSQPSVHAALLEGGVSSVVGTQRFGDCLVSR